MSRLNFRASWGRIAAMMAIIGSVTGLGLAIPSGAQAATTVRLATATVNDVQTEAIKRYAERIEARSNGRFKTELYPAAQLGSNARMIEGLQFGTVQVYVGPPAYLAGVDPRFQVLDSPGIFEDFAHAARTISDPEFHDVFLALGEAKGLKGVSLFMYSLTAYASRDPLRTLNDFRGQKLRVLSSKMEREATNRLGATAVPIDFSGVVPALQQGTIDGVKTGMSVFTSLKLYDVVKYVTLTHEAIVPEVMMVSKRWFDAQPADVQAMLVEEGRALEAELNEWTLNAQQEAQQIWREHGGEIFTLSDADQTEMMSRLADAAREVYGANPAQKALYDQLLAVAQKHRE